MKRVLGVLGAAAGLAFGLFVSFNATKVHDWRQLDRGIEYRVFRLALVPLTGDGLLHVVRLDPARVSFELGLRSEDGSLHTAADWASRQGWSVVFNAGMYETDLRTNVGYLRHRGHLNNPRWKVNFEAVLALDGADGGIALLDRDAPTFAAESAGYDTLVQNLRTVKAPGTNVWEPNDRMWTEASVAQDREGRILFLFTGTRFNQSELNDRILALPLNIVRAMHVEGGPEGSLSIHTPVMTVDLDGETALGKTHQWEIPNVIGVRSKP